MPLDPATASALLSAGKETGKALIQPATDLGMYYLQRHHALKDYERVRQDNLSDFNMANKYNSPVEQMNRLREAGLNPHLVYGKGADMASVQMKGADIDSPKAPQMAPLKDYMASKQVEQNLEQMGGAIKLQQAQTDNVMADTKNKQSQNSLMELDVISKQIKNAVDGLEKDKLKALYDDMLERYRLENDILKSDLNLKDQSFTLNLEANDRQWLDSSMSRQDALQRIAESKSRIALNKKQQAKTDAETIKINRDIDMMYYAEEMAKIDLVVKQFTEEAVKNGLDPKSPWFWNTWVNFCDWAIENTVGAVKTATDPTTKGSASDKFFKFKADLNVDNMSERAKEYFRKHRVPDRQQQYQGGSW